MREREVKNLRGNIVDGMWHGVKYIGNKRPVTAHNTLEE